MRINKMKKLLSLLGTTTLVASPIIAMGGGLLNNNLNSNKEVKSRETSEPVSATYTYNFDNWTDTGSTLECTESTNNFKVIISYEGNKLVSTQVEQLGSTTFNFVDSTQIDLSKISTKFTIFGNMLFYYNWQVGNRIIDQESYNNNLNFYEKFLFSINSVIMPDSITKIEDGQFSDSFYPITNLTKPENNLSIWTKSDYILKADEGDSLEINSGCFVGLSATGSFKNIVFSKNLSYIGDCSFAGQWLVTLQDSEGDASYINIVFPSSITYIGKLCFYMNFYISEIENLENTKISNVEFGAFGWTPYMTSNIILPESVNAIEDFAFAFNFMSSCTLPKKLNYIGGGAFYCSSALKSIIIPTAVENIGIGAFNTCEQLSQIIFNKSSNSLITNISTSCIEFNKTYNEYISEEPQMSYVKNTFLTMNPSGTKILFNDDTTRDKYQGFVNQSQNNWGVDNTGISAENQVTIETNPNPLTPDDPVEPSDHEPNSIKILDQSGKQVANNATFKIDSTSGSIQFSAQVLDINGSSDQVDQSVKWSLTSDNENITCQDGTISWSNLTSGQIYSFNLKATSTANSSVETSINNIKLNFNAASQNLWEQYMWLWIALMVITLAIIVITTVTVIVKKRRRSIYSKDKDLEKLLK